LTEKLVFVIIIPSKRDNKGNLEMAKLIITALEQAVMNNIKAFGVGQNIPQNIIATAGGIKATQVGAVVNNMVAKGLMVRNKDLFGTNVSLTRSGKIQTTKLFKQAA
jgi:hypothetical protein